MLLCLLSQDILTLAQFTLGLLTPLNFFFFKKKSSVSAIWNQSAHLEKEKRNSYGKWVKNGVKGSNVNQATYCQKHIPTQIVIPCSLVQVGFS